MEGHSEFFQPWSKVSQSSTPRSIDQKMIPVMVRIFFSFDHGFPLVKDKNLCKIQVKSAFYRFFVSYYHVTNRVN